jgi:large subunit ribosomal protein L24
MRKFHIKKNDEVVVIAGADKGKRGKVINVVAKKQRVFVQGVKIVKRHMRKSQQHPNGAIVEREGAIHISNVMIAADFDAKTPTAKAGA